MEIHTPAGDPEHEKFMRRGQFYESPEAEVDDILLEHQETVSLQTIEMEKKVLGCFRIFRLMVKSLFFLAIAYALVGHALYYMHIWDPCSYKFVYKRSYTTDNYGMGVVLQCTKREDYMCLVPGFHGTKTYTGWDLSGTGCDDSLLTRQEDTYAPYKL